VNLLNNSDHIVDLIEPFRQKMVYLPEMNGSFSIKDMLPAEVKASHEALLTYCDLDIWAMVKVWKTDGNGKIIKPVFEISAKCFYIML
jgi:hypothetical protein